MASSTIPRGVGRPHTPSNIDLHGISLAKGDAFESIQTHMKKGRVRLRCEFHPIVRGTTSVWGFGGWDESLRSMRPDEDDVTYIHIFQWGDYYAVAEFSGPALDNLKSFFLALSSTGFVKGYYPLEPAVVLAISDECYFTSLPARLVAFGNCDLVFEKVAN